MQKVIAIIAIGDKEYEEELTVESLDSPEDAVRKVIKFFNQVEKTRYGKKAQLRRFVCIKDLGREYEDHDWDKVNFVSLPDGSDRWKCKKCGQVIKRVLGQGFEHAKPCKLKQPEKRK